MCVCAQSTYICEPVQTINTISPTIENEYDLYLWTLPKKAKEKENKLFAKDTGVVGAEGWVGRCKLPFFTSSSGEPNK